MSSRCTLNTILALLALPLVFSKGLQPQIPSVASFTPNEAQRSFVLSPEVRIVVESGFECVGSPSLLDYAKTFREDLISITGFNRIFEVAVDTHPSKPFADTDPESTIFLTLGASASNHTLFNGHPTGEGCEFDVSSALYSIVGVEPIGAWWCTRTLLQQVVMLSNGTDLPSSIAIPAGSGSDTPGWAVRGFMLDVGRHWFESGFLADLCIYASFFKINEFHLHASDNLWNPDFLYGEGNEGWKKLYAGFRFRPPLNSSIVGLVPRRNESWSKDEFLALQSTCSNHGVSLIPEIDTPGHSLVITQWKSELMAAGAPDQLNLSFPDTIPSIKSIWDEFLPWFAAPEVSIGADEYNPALANDYISFVNEMSTHIFNESRKSIRVWGTNEPSNTSSISTNVTIQHWDFPGDSIPVQLFERGYSVINSEQYFLYLDGKTSDDGQFPQELDQSLMWNGAPGGKGWAPNIFSPRDCSNNTSIDNPHLRGAIFALWNDWGNNATTPLEIYYQLSRSLAVFAEKTWAGSEVRQTALTRDQFDTVYPILNAAAPGQNLNRIVSPRQFDVIYEYDFISKLPVNTSIPSAGPPYSFTFTLKPPSNLTSSVLFSGLDSRLHLEPGGSLAFEDPSTRQFYFTDRNFTLPEDRYTTVEIRATREYTYGVINGNEFDTVWWVTSMDIWGEYMAEGNMSFAAPSLMIGGDGSKSVNLRNVVLKVGEF